MNLWSTFLDLDKLHESTDKKWWTDQALDELKNKPKTEWTEDDWDTYHYCKNANAERDYYDSLDEDFYDFSPTSTSSWVKMQPSNNQAPVSQPATQASVYVISARYDAKVQDPNFCVFDQGDDIWYGAVEYVDKLTHTTGTFDSLRDAVSAANKNNQHLDLYIYEYDASANKLTLVGKVDQAASKPTKTTPATGKPIVTIVKDSGKLRALAADGDGQGNPAAFVQFPTALRTNEGQQYEVDQLVWTGKFYRVSGNINPVITNVTASTTSTQNINENINKENSKMNFNSVFEELNKLYEPEAVVENFNNDNGVEAWSKNVIGYYTQAAKELGLTDYTMKSTGYGDNSKVIISAVKDGKKLSVEESNEAMTHDIKNVEDAKEFIKFVLPELTEAAANEEPVEEGCAKEALNEAADEEIEFAEEPVDVIPEEETEEAPAEEDVNTVEEFLKSIGEYDGDLKLEFKPIVIDGKEYSVTNILWSDEEEGKLVAEFVVDMPEEEAVEEEAVEEEPVEESLDADKIEELFNANISADLRNFGGTGNKVSVLGGGIDEELETKELPEEDEDLDELFNANIKLDARGFGGSGNDVGIL
jgi:hypothetical protein